VPCHWKQQWTATIGEDGHKSDEQLLELLNLIHVIIVMIRWTGLAPWEYASTAAANVAKSVGCNAGWALMTSGERIY